MRKRLLSLILAVILLLTMSPSIFALDGGTNESASIIVGTIDPRINEIVDAYLNGTYISQNLSDALQAKQAFERVAGVSHLDNGTVNYIYDLKQTGQSTFEATQIAFYTSLEQQNQGTLGGVVLFSTMVYDQKFFGEVYPFILLQGVKGGVVRNETSSRCTNLYLAYAAQGDAYTASGTRVGGKTSVAEYVQVATYPPVGTAYSISGPNDYYYSLNTGYTNIGSRCKGIIALGSTTLTDTLEFGSQMQGTGS